MMPLRHLWTGSPCQRTVRASISFRSWSGQLAVRHTGMPLRYLWKGSPCQSADRCPLRHAGMALRYLWARSPCRRPVKRPLCHTITCIRWAPPASRALGSTRLSESSAVRDHRSSGYYPVNQSRLGIMHFLIKDFLPPGILCLSIKYFLSTSHPLTHQSGQYRHRNLNCR